MSIESNLNVNPQGEGGEHNGDKKGEIVDGGSLSPEEEREMREKVENFVKRNRDRLPSDPVACNKCIDGRPSKFSDECEDGAKPAAFPGADLGVAMLLLEQGMSAEEAFKVMLEFLGEKGYVFNFHSDTHHKDEGHGVIGCGHANASYENNQHYNFDKNEVKKLIELAKEAAEKMPDRVKEDILVGDHGELAILSVDDPTETVRHYDPETGEQYFVYDKGAHMRYIDDFAQFLQKKGYDISSDGLKKAAEEQANATLALLSSSKGKPIFSVSFREGIKVDYVKNAPKVEE